MPDAVALPLTRATFGLIASHDSRRLAWLAAVAVIVIVWAWRVRRLARGPDPHFARLGAAAWRLRTHLPMAATLAWLAAWSLAGADPIADGWPVGPGPWPRA